MTALNVSQIPASVNTVEKLVAWGGAILAQLNADKSVVTAPGVAELASQASDYRFPNDPTQNRFAVVIYFALGAEYRQNASHKGVLEFSTQQIPAGFLS